MVQAFTQGRSKRDEWREGWPLVLASAGGMAFYALAISSMGIFVIPLESSLGWSRALITSGLTVSAFVALFLAGPVGMLIDRYGPRRIAIPGVILFSSAFALLGTVSSSPLHWWGLWLLVAICSLMIKATVWSAAIGSRFDRSIGLALALALSGSGLSGLAAPILGNWLIQSYGWRFAYPGLSGLYLLIVLPLLVLFFFSASDRERTGQSPVRLAQADVASRKAAAGDAFRSVTFWKLALASFFVIIPATSLSVHFVPMLTGGGLSPALAALAAGAIGSATFVGRIISGTLLDRVNARVLGGTLMLMPGLVAIGFLNLPLDVPTAVILAVMLGFSTGAELEVSAYLSTRYFGMERFGTLFGVIVGLMIFASGISPPLFGYVYDLTASYDGALVPAALSSLIAGMLIYSLRTPPAKISGEQN